MPLEINYLLSRALTAILAIGRLLGVFNMSGKMNPFIIDFKEIKIVGRVNSSMSFFKDSPVGVCVIVGNAEKSGSPSARVSLLPIGTTPSFSFNSTNAAPFLIAADTEASSL